MATYIKTLKEDNGDITYPQTKAGAVLLNNGSDLETALAAKADASTVNQKITVGDVQSTDIVANAVTSAKLADNAITTPKIADGAVTSDKIDWTTMSHVSNVGSSVIDVTQTVTMLCEVTIPEAGVYYASATVDPNLLGNNVGDANVHLALNGGNSIAGSQVFFNNNGKNWFIGGVHVSAIVSCKKGDKIQLRGQSQADKWQAGERRRLDAFRIG